MAPTTARSRSAAMLRRRAAAAALCGCGGGSNQASAAVIARAFVPPNTRGLGAAGPRGGRLATKLSKADGCERPMAHGAAQRARSVTTVSLSGQQSRVRSCLALPVENETAEERKQEAAVVGWTVAAGRVRPVVPRGASFWDLTQLLGSDMGYMTSDLRSGKPEVMTSAMTSTDVSCGGTGSPATRVGAGEAAQGRGALLRPTHAQ